MRSTGLALAGLTAVTAWAGQDAEAAGPRERQTFEVRRASSEIEIDGRVDEAAWADALTIPLDLEWSPGDGVAPPVETEAMITYDSKKLYIAFRASDPDPSAIRAHLMDRDDVDTFVQDDHVVVMLDTFNDERRAVQLRVNPLGVQMDALFSQNEGIEDFAWDIIWDSAGRITEEGYELELAVPLNQLRFPRSAGALTWGIELQRSYPRSNRHRISDFYRDRDNSCILCQINKVAGFEGLEPGLNLEVTPTVTASRTDTLDRFPDGALVEGGEEVEPGITARWSVTPNMTLSGTVNPDFSQVEADVAQLAVNERFALFFPEKRPFFLEGVDLFATPIDAVFTRSVVDPDWGVKLTGKQGPNALGVFAAHDSVNSFLVPSSQLSGTAFVDQDLTDGVLRYRRDVGSSSSVGVLYAGREGDEYHNRVGGVDAFWRIDGRNTIELQYLRSDTLYPGEVANRFGQPTDSFDGGAFELDWSYDSRTWDASVEVQSYDSGFRADSGFVSRVDYRTAELFLGHNFWGEPDDWYSSAFVGLFTFRTEDQGGRLLDSKIDLFANFNGPLQSFAEVSLERNRTFFDGVLYDDLNRAQVFAQLQPTGKLKASLFVDVGDTVDFANNQPADLLNLSPTLELKLGSHVNAQLRHTRRTLDVPGGELFTADLSQLRLVYQFNVRTFVRAILQRSDIERDPALFSFPVEAQSEDLFTQLLFSYKLNPQTLLFLGYSDNRAGLDGVSLTQTDRTLFLKIGYAWVL